MKDFEFNTEAAIWLGVSIALPILGFILFLVWRKSKPNRATACLYGAIGGVVVGFVINLIQH